MTETEGRNLTSTIGWNDLMNDARRNAESYRYYGRVSVRGVRLADGRWAYVMHLNGVDMRTAFDLPEITAVRGGFRW